MDRNLYEGSRLHCPTLGLFVRAYGIGVQLFNFPRRGGLELEDLWGRYKEDTLLDVCLSRGHVWKRGVKTLKSIKIMPSSAFVEDASECMDHFGNRLWAVGDLYEVPVDIVRQMLKEQEAQGNVRDVTVFEVSRGTNQLRGGMDWERTTEGRAFWDAVLFNKDYKLFFDVFMGNRSMYHTEVDWQRDCLVKRREAYLLDYAPAVLLEPVECYESSIGSLIYNK